jgi:hypothetical protein
MKPTLTAAVWRTWFTALLLALAACGGGVETGGTGAGAYVQGPISGFGSVIVAGVRFDDSSASIEDVDGRVRGRDDLRLGMLVEVESGPIGDDGSGGRAATAVRVRLASELLGPVTSTPTNALLSVLGQPVRLTSATVIDGVAGGAAALQLGDVVEVHGFFAPADGYVATRIERRSSAPASYRVRGAVRELDAAAKTMRIGLQGFDLTATGVPAGLADGQFVRLSLQTVQIGGRWPVIAIAVETRSAGERDEAEVEGLISAFNSAAQFSVNGVRVDASAANFIDGSAGLREGVRVKVRGRSQAGVLLAAVVDIRSDDDAFSEGVDIRDAIGSVDAAAQTFTLRGITVFYGSQPAPRFDNGTAADLASTVPVRVRGNLSADRTRLVATRIDFVKN